MQVVALRAIRILGNNKQGLRHLDCLNNFDQITDLYARSFTLLISSLNKPWANLDGQSTVKGPLLPFLKKKKGIINITD